MQKALSIKALLFILLSALSMVGYGQSVGWNYVMTIEPDNGNSFISRDALAGSYPHLTPYSYCANNPLIYIDPTGNDIWQIDNHGYIVSIIETTEFDKIEMNDDNKHLFNNKWYMAMPKFRIYHVPTKKYINYNQNGVIK